MIEYVSSPDRYVYHYTSASTALTHILKNGTIQLGAYTGTNDPKETKAWVFDLLTFQNRDLHKYGAGRLSHWLSSEIKARAKMACFATESGFLSGDHMADICHRGFAKARMWAQYADKHRGVCLAFDREKLLTAVKENFGNYPALQGHIHYRNANLVRGIEHHEFALDIDQYEVLGPTHYVRYHIEKNFRALFFEKLKDWRDESEWRIIVFNEQRENLYLPIRDALVAVVHGDSTDPDMSESIMSATKDLPVEHLGLAWKNSTPWYDYASFNWIPGKITNPRRPPP